MGDVLIGLTPAIIASVYHFRLNAVILLLTCIVSCLACEALCNLMLKRKQSAGDLSAVVTAVILALSLPPKLPVSMAIVGSFFAIGICKMAFGGLGNNIFNPAMGARAFLMVSFGMSMATWQLPAQLNPEMPTLSPKTQISADFMQAADIEAGSVEIDAVTQATPLSWVKKAIKSRSATEAADIVKAEYPNSQLRFALLGNTAGSLGETNALALLIGGIYLLVRRTITWHVPVAVLGSAFIFAEIAFAVDSEAFANPLLHIVSGGIMMCAFFIATDPVSSPMTRTGMIVFGCGVGLLIVLIRMFGAFPEGVMFAILIMNALSPLIDRVCVSKPIGGFPNGK
jgi:electron transport complex protein RnfD